jgi:Chaperone of endosialidase
MASILSAGTTSATAMVHTADTSGVLQLASNNGTVALTVSTAQNIGIGTTSPSTTLEVSASGVNGINLATSGSVDSPRLFFTGSGGAGTSVVINNANGSLRFGYAGTVGSSSGTESARIDSSGRFVMNSGPNSSQATGAIMGYVTTAVDNEGIIQAYNGNTGSGGVCNASFIAKSKYGWSQFMQWDTNGLRVGNRATSNGGTGNIYFTTGNDAVNAIFATGTNLGTGTVYSNSGVFTNTNPSDARLKTNVQDLSFGLDFILGLRPVTYDWINDRGNQGTQYGFIAQEVQVLKPELVDEFDAMVNPDSMDSADHQMVKRLGLKKEGIYTALVKAIQELNAKVTALENK